MVEQVTRHASSMDSCIKHYIAKSVHVATGKEETVKEVCMQVCNESMKTKLASTVENTSEYRMCRALMEQNQSFSVESMLKCCDVMSIGLACIMW